MRFGHTGIISKNGKLNVASLSKRMLDHCQQRIMTEMEVPSIAPALVGVLATPGIPDKTSCICSMSQALTRILFWHPVLLERGKGDIHR